MRLDGKVLGDVVTVSEGCDDGEFGGALVGLAVGVDLDGCNDGTLVISEGCDDGAGLAVGVDLDGCNDGTLVGIDVGSLDGLLLGSDDWLSDGCNDGLLLGDK